MSNESLTPIIETQGVVANNGVTSFTYVLSLNGQAIPDITSEQLQSLARLCTQFAKIDESINPQNHE